MRMNLWISVRTSGQRILIGWPVWYVCKKVKAAKFLLATVQEVRLNMRLVHGLGDAKKSKIESEPYDSVNICHQLHLEYNLCWRFLIA